MTVATTDVFSHSHIALTAAVTGVVAAGSALWRFKNPSRLIGGLTVGVLAAVAVFLWRASANLPQLNRDARRFLCE
jgi:hypothetical protein